MALTVVILAGSRYVHYGIVWECVLFSKMRLWAVWKAMIFSNLFNRQNKRGTSLYAFRAIVIMLHKISSRNG